MVSSCCPPGSLGPVPPPLPSSRAANLKGRMEMITPPSPDDYFDLENDLQPMPCYCTTGQRVVEEAAAAAAGATAAVDPKTAAQHVPVSESSLWKSTTRVVVVFTDVFGLNSGNHKVFADALAARLNANTTDDNATSSTLVVVPDIFRGQPLAKYHSNIPVMLQIIWNMVVRFNANAYDRDFQHLIMPWLLRKLNHVPQKEVMENVACVGFCFGGWCVARALALSNESEQRNTNNTNNNSDKNNTTTKESSVPFPMKCGIGIHPALKPEAMHQQGQAKLARRMGRKPVLWLSAGNDELKPGGQHLVVTTNAQMRNVAEADVAIEFPNMVHGWVSRGNGNSDPSIAQEQERALQLTVDFIHQHCPV